MQRYQVSQCSSWEELRVLLVQSRTRQVLGDILNSLDIHALVVGLCPSGLQPYFVHWRYTVTLEFGSVKSLEEGEGLWYGLSIICCCL